MVEAYVLLSIMVIRVAWDDGVTTALVRSATLKLVWSLAKRITAYFCMCVFMCARIYVSLFHVFGLRVTNHKSSYHP